MEGALLVLLVAGLSLKNLKPRVWDPQSPFYLRELPAVMVSYADFDRMPARRRAAMEHGLHAHLGVPQDVKIYLDNGAFSFLRRHGELPQREYEEFVAAARPDWWPIPRDVIPNPGMTAYEQHDCLARTMQANLAYQHDGFVPIIHVGPLIDAYVAAVRSNDRLASKPSLGIGGIVPQLLRAPKARPARETLAGLQRARRAFRDKTIHLFGVGGTATLHIAALVGIDSVDSSGWRNRAARGIVQLPGRGDRLVADLGSWRGRVPSDAEWQMLGSCQCPACQQFGLSGITATGIDGFCHRASHNLWTLSHELAHVEQHLAAGSYGDWYRGHIENSIYRPLIEAVWRQRTTDGDE